MLQSISGAARTALSCLLVSFPFSTAQAATVENDGAGSGQQSG